MRAIRSCALACALGLLSHSAFADGDISAEARAHFNAGVSFLQDPDGARFEEAYREFKEAYAASHSWKVLGNLGITAMKLERDGEAIQAFTAYLKEGGAELDSDEKAQVERDLAMLTASASKVTLTTSPAGASILDERISANGGVVLNSYGPVDGPLDIQVRAGRHRFTAKFDGKVASVWEVELSPKQAVARSLTLGDVPTSKSSAPVTTPVVPPAANGLRIASYAVLGVGVAGLAVGSYFGVTSRKKFDETNALCPSSGTCTLTTAESRKRDDLSKQAENNQMFSIIGFAAGGVGVAAGITLFVLSRSEKEPNAQARLYVGPSELGIVGGF